MLNSLFELEKNIQEIIFSRIPNMEFKSMYIDYHPPIVERMWFQYGEIRVCLHRIHKCNEATDALFHPHPWKSAVRIIKGSYEMGVGHSETNEMPVIDCHGVFPAGTCYQMIEPHAWHYVNPTSDYVYSLMITGEKYEREMPVVPEPDKKFRSLTVEEQNHILDVFKECYLKETTWGSKELTFIDGKFM